MTSNIRLERVCGYCNNLFIAKTTVTLYCSENCSKRAYKARKRAEKIERSMQTLPSNYKLVDWDKLQQKEYLTIKEACILLSLSRTSLYRLIKKYPMIVTKLGGKIIINKTKLNTIIN